MRCWPSRSASSPARCCRSVKELCNNIRFSRSGLEEGTLITLYHSPQTRSASILWLLEELEVPYQTKAVDFRRPDGTGKKDPSNPHPHGKVPALSDDGEFVFEGAAIALYLTDKYRKKKLGPAVGKPKRGEYLSW